MNKLFSALLANNLVQTCEPLRRRGVLAWIGKHDLTLVLRFHQIFERLGRFRRFDDAGVINHADDRAAICRTEIGIDDSFGKSLCRRRIVFSQKAVFLNQSQRRSRGQHDVGLWFAGARLRGYPVGNLVGCVAPVVDVEPGLLLKCGGTINPSCRFPESRKRPLCRLLFWPLRSVCILAARASTVPTIMTKLAIASGFKCCIIINLCPFLFICGEPQARVMSISLMQVRRTQSRLYRE